MSKDGTHPSLRGIVDTLTGAAVILKSGIPHRNRLAVILIDSAFETGCRAYLKHRCRIQLTEAHRHRENLMKVIAAKLSDIDPQVWDTINYYYDEIRCDFYHQSAGKTLIDVDMLDYKETVEFVIDKAFGVNISELVASALLKLTSESSESEVPSSVASVIELSKVVGPVNKVLLAIACLNPKGIEEINSYFRKEGDSLRLKPGEFTNIVARNSGSKKLFYYDQELKRWQLSGLGKFRLKQMKLEVQNG